jgi:Calpain family cysteine protease
MALYQNKTGTPGPWGPTTGGIGAGRPLWTKGSPPPSPPALKSAAVATKMPGPTKDNDSREVHEVTWPLYAANSPAVREVRQAGSLANCPVAAILAALANTSSGQTLIKRMITTTNAAATTDISSAGELANPHPDPIIRSSRYFTVTVGGKSVVVTDVLYTDDADRNWSPFYMRDKSDNSIWAAIIEKALAAHLGSYESIDALGLSANAFWEKIIGSKPKGIAVELGMSTTPVVNAATAAGRVPTIAASRDTQTKVASISPFHGYAVLGMQGPNIRLYDPALVETKLLSQQDFVTAFQAMFWM